MQNAPQSYSTNPPPLPIGNSDWAEVKAGYWSADKTQLISGLIDRKTTVALFTRPRRFGKTFAIEMLKTFFEKTEKSNAHLFEGTKVWQNPAHRAEQGKYPVIHITFKDAKGGDWPQTISKIMAAVRDEFDRHSYIFTDDKVKESARAFYHELCIELKSPENSDRSLGILATALHAFHEEKPVILIDEYDSPINYAATHGFGEEALQFFRNFLSSALKDGKHCRLGVITGILRVAKEGVLSGLNNLEVWSVFDDDYSDCFGFTEDEVQGLLSVYGRPEKIVEAKDWYDGYRFGPSEIYNPWSVLNYARRGFVPEAYWTSTSSNDLVTDVLSRLSPEMREGLEGLFGDEGQLLPCAKELGKYGVIQNTPDILWSLLVHTGYLKVLSGPNNDGDALLAFPNRELRKVFKDDILDPIKQYPVAGGDVRGIMRALTSGDAEKFRKSVEAFLVSSASYFDMAHEDFFHGLLLGLLALGRDHYEISSNREEGDGRPDIAMKPRPGVQLPGVILELKSPKLPARASQKRIAAALEAAAREARDQIDEKRYATEMERELAERGTGNRERGTGNNRQTVKPSNRQTAQDAPPRVLCYGVGFLGKRVALAK